MPQLRFIWCVAVAGTLVPPLFGGEPATWGVDHAGIRIGADLGEVVGLNLGEAYLNWSTPVRWNPAGRLQLSLVAELAAGILSSGSETGAVFKAGPGLRAAWGDFPVRAQVSFSPTLLTRSNYSGWDVGGNIHFTSAADIFWNFTPAWSLGYHIQHTSNADLGYPNPGIDLHALDIAYHF